MVLSAVMAVAILMWLAYSVMVHARGSMGGLDAKGDSPSADDDISELSTFLDSARTTDQKQLQKAVERVAAELRGDMRREIDIIRADLATGLKRQDAMVSAALQELAANLAAVGGNRSLHLAGPKVDLAVDLMVAKDKDQEPKLKPVVRRVSVPARGPPQVISLTTSQCIDAGNPRWAGAKVKLWACNQNTPQKIEYIDQQLRYGSGECLESKGAQQPVVLAPCHAGDTAQQWLFEVTGGRQMPAGPLKNIKDGQCLTAAKDEEPVFVDRCASFCNQSWSLPATQVTRTETVAPSGTPSGKAGRILCWVLTMPASHDTKARAVNQTWGRHCDYLLFMTTENHPSLQTIKLDLGGPETRAKLWTKSKRAWEHVYENYLDKADWFLKADDDTYVVWDNMHDFLSKFDTNKPYHFGRFFHLMGDSTRQYYSGGAGIVLSKEALRRLGSKVKADKNFWAGSPTGPEDLHTSDTLKKVGVMAQPSVDETGAQLFMTLGVRSERRGRRDPTFWYWKYSPDAREGPQCCSDHWISTHYTPAKDMYAIDELESSHCSMDPDVFPFLRLRGPVSAPGDAKM